MERAAYAEREPAFPALVFRKEKSTYEQTQRAERRWLQDPGYDVCAPWTERSSCDANRDRQDGAHQPSFPIQVPGETSNRDSNSCDDRYGRERYQPAAGICADHPRAQGTKDRVVMLRLIHQPVLG